MAPGSSLPPISKQNREKVIKHLLLFHAQIQKHLDQLTLQAEDPGLHKTTLREYKRFLSEFIRHYHAFGERSEWSDENERVEYAWKEACMLYWDMFPSSYKEQSSISGLVKSAIEDTYQKVKRALQSDTPTLFIRPIDHLGMLEETIAFILEKNPRIKIATLTSTPFTDRTQMVGAWLPSEHGVLEFKKGILYRLVESAGKDPDFVYLLVIEQIEAIPPKVRAMINQFILVGEMEIAETGTLLRWPKNFKMLVILSEGAILEDNAFYDRFARKYLPSPSLEDIQGIFQIEYQLPRNAISSLLGLYQNESFPGEPQIPFGHLLTIASYIKGRLGEPNCRSPESQVILEEIELFFLKDKKYPHCLEYSPSRKALVIDHVPLVLAPSLARELETVLFDSWEAKKEIERFVYRKTGLALTNDALRSLSALARNIRYGAGLARLEGPTGGGKTFVAQAISHLMGLPFYGEPIHGESKQAKWLGVFKPTSRGEYELDQDTVFLENLERGGVIALSELNTAVKNGYAKLGWWLIPIARGKREIELNEYPTCARDYKVIRRSERSLIVIDINPEETYEARGKLPPLLEAFTPRIWIEGNLSLDETKSVAAYYLSNASFPISKEVEDCIALVHHSIQEEARKQRMEGFPFFVTIRELKRSCRLIVDAYSTGQLKEYFFPAISIFYLCSVREASLRNCLLKGFQKEICERICIQTMRYAETVELPWPKHPQIVRTFPPPKTLFLIFCDWAAHMIRKPWIYWLQKGTLSAEIKIIPLYAVHIDERRNRIAELACTLLGHEETISSLLTAKNERNKMVILSSSGNKIKIWTEEEGWRFMVQTLEGHPDYIESVTLLQAKNKKWVIVSVGSEGTLKIWRATGPYSFIVQTLKGKPHFTAAQAFFGKSGHLLIVLSYPRGLTIWEEKYPCHFLRRHVSLPIGNGPVYILQKKDKRLVVVSREYSRIKIFTQNTTGPFQQRVLEDDSSLVSIFALIDPMGYFYIFGQGGELGLKIWKEDRTGHFHLYKVPGQCGKYLVMDAVSRLGTLAVLSGNQEGQIRFCSNYGKPGHFKASTLDSSHGAVRAVSILNETKESVVFVTAGDDKTIKVWKMDQDFQSRQMMNSMYSLLSGHSDSAHFLAYFDHHWPRFRPPTLLFVKPGEKDWACLYTTIKKKYPDAYIEKIRASEFLDEFSLMGGYIVDETSVGKRKFKWAEGIFPRIVREAKKERDQGIRRLFVVVFENYHYLRPRVAVALNSILQEGVYYSPVEKKSACVPENVCFFALSSYESPPKISLAEQSRWVRLYFSELPSYEKEANEASPEGHALERVKKGPSMDDMTPPLFYEKELDRCYPVFARTLRAPGSDLLVVTGELYHTQTRIADAWRQGKSVILQGEPGLGKTDMAIDIARRFGLPFFVYSAYDRSHVQDLIGHYTQDANGRFVLTTEPENGHYRIPFLELFSHGGVFVFDEGAVGKRAQSLISWLSGIVKGERELILNEHPGREPYWIERHKEFHLIITTNPPRQTVGREEIPPEVFENAVVIELDSPGFFTYRHIVERLYLQDAFFERAEFQDRSKEAPFSFQEHRLLKATKGGNLKVSPARKEDWMDFQIRLHLFVQKAIEQHVENPAMHLVTIRDIKNWTNTFLKSLATDEFYPAFASAFELVYLKQLNPKTREALLLDFSSDEGEIRKCFFRALQEKRPVKIGPGSLKSEEELKVDLQRALGAGLSVLLFLEPGVREREILSSFCQSRGYAAFHLESSPEMGVEDLLGCIFPVFPEENLPLEFRVKPGFLSRHTIESKDERDHPIKTVLVLHDIDAMPEKVRVALNHFLLKGYHEQHDDSGRVFYKYLPSDTRIVATMSLSSPRPVSSAFLNRFVKLYAPALPTFIEGFSDSLVLFMHEFDLSEREARWVQYIYEMVRSLESEGGFWPSSKSYRFTVKEAILHAQFIQQSREDGLCGYEGEEEGADFMVAREALRVYGAVLQEHEKDHSNFVEIILKSIFSHDAVREIPGVVRMENGIPMSFSGVLPPAPPVTPLSSMDPRFLLTMVPCLVNTIALVLRGWRAGKMVLLVGETGVAKTTLGIFLAKLMGFESYVYSTHGESKSRDFTLSLHLNERGGYELREQEFLKRIRQGRQVIVFDEVNIRPSILWALQGIVRGEKEIFVEVPGESPYRVPIGENVYFLMTMNPESYAGRNEMPPIFMENVFKVWVRSDYRPEELENILDDFFQLQETHHLSFLKKNLHIRELKSWLRDKKE